MAGLTGAAAQQVVTALQSGHRSWWIAVLTGAVGVVWTTRTLARNLVLVNAHVWQASVQRQRRKHALTTATVIGLVFFGLAGLAAGLPYLFRHIRGGILLGILLEALITTAAWLVVSLRLPDGRRHWTDLLPGATMLGVAVAVAHAGSRIYLPRKIEQSSELYGALGLAAVMLGWLLLIGQIIVASGLTNCVWLEYRERRATQKEAADRAPGPSPSYRGSVDPQPK
jgi:uncharacterized BrkB/YihY/UPF0761 family membrane protein